MLLENFRLAFVAIRVNKMRSFLTMLGIIIGISSVISIVSIGDTMRGVMAAQYESIGINRVIMYVGYSEDFSEENNYFDFDDVEALGKAFPEQIEYIVPSVSANANLTYQKNKTKQVSVNLMGVGANYANVQPIDIVYGRMISEGDVNSKKAHIVIEATTAMELFKKENAVGEVVRGNLNGNVEDMLVVGVYKEKETPMSALFFGSNKNAYSPYTLLASPDTYTFSLDFYVRDGIDTKQFQTLAVPYVAKMKNQQPEAIMYTSAKDEMSMIDNIMLGLSVGVGAIAAISLVVGGIGIMNIMLVSVTERTREIGIRKALGARTKDVLIQFLMESALISAAGGIVGVVLGVGLVSLGGALVKVAVVVNPWVIIIAVAFSAVVGIFFGIYPASKAAKADPIEALRYE